jgi:hypothetical protein
LALVGGGSFARYRMPQYFDQENFDAFVVNLDEQFLQSSAVILEDFYRELQRVNSSEGIDADYSYEFRLLEYGRQRTNSFSEFYGGRGNRAPGSRRSTMNPTLFQKIALYKTKINV